MENFEGHDRFAFPDFITSVSAGYGGESLLIEGSEKTALYDCGMAYCADQTVENIKRALNGRALDYVLCSHTHYDHIGGLPYVREQWPQVVVCGAEHGKQVFQRPGARRLMKKLGDVAEIAYGSGDTDKVKTDGLAITRVIGEGDVIDLGSRSIIVMEARGHTDCSLAFKIEPEHILISSETTGVLFGRGRAHTATLKSHEGVIRTIHKCRAYRPKMVICPHYGVMPGDYIDEYWDLIENIANEEKEFIEGMWKKGLSQEEMLQAMTDKYWTKERETEQPIEAFLVNARATIDVYRPE